MIRLSTYFSYGRVLIQPILPNHRKTSVCGMSRPMIYCYIPAKMTVATDKLVYDISPAKTDSFKPVDQF